MAQTYTVKAGDTLSGIAAQYGTTSKNITGYASGDPNLIRAGEQLTIGSPAPSLPTTPSTSTLTSSQVEAGSNLPDPSNLIGSADGSNRASFSDTISAVAGTTLSSTGKSLDALYKQREDIAAKQKVAEQAKVDGLTTQLSEQQHSTAAQDALKAVNDKFHVDDTISKLEEVQQKISDAQEALNLGLIYEGNRPVRMSLLNGRSASLQKQGLATIGALQGTASALQGNIDLAKSYAATTIDAINTDNQNSISAIQTLLKLHEDNLITLTADEKSAADERLAAIQTESDKLLANKDDVSNFMTTYPTAFLKGGVTLLDTKETALQKMLPYLSQEEQAKIKGTGTAAAKQAAESQLLQLKANGMPYEDALTAFGDVLMPAEIAPYYGRSATDPSAGKGDIYTNFLNLDGTPKAGYIAALDDKGNPIIQKAPEPSGPNWFQKSASWIGSLFTNA